MKITFYEHADRKFEVLRTHGFTVTRSQVLETVQNPSSVMPGRKGRKVAEKPVSATHKLRVVFEERNGNIEIVTFYPRRIGK